MQLRHIRGLAFGGVVGPIVFVATWAVRGALRTDYSPVHDAISQLAASDAPQRWWMTAAFVVFGVATSGYAVALRATMPGPAWVAALGTALSTIGAAAAPLGSADAAHNLFAAIAYVSLAATPLLGAWQFRRTGQRRWTLLSWACGATTAAALLVSTVDTAHGLTQRVGLTATDIWIVATAWTIWRTGGLVRGQRPPTGGAAGR